MKDWAAKFFGWLASWAAPQVIAYLLGKVDPSALADKLRPSLKALMAKMGPDWQKNFSTALNKIAAFVDDLVNDPTVGV